MVCEHNMYMYMPLSIYKEQTTDMLKAIPRTTKLNAEAATGETAEWRAAARRRVLTAVVRLVSQIDAQ